MHVCSGSPEVRKAYLEKFARALRGPTPALNRERGRLSANCDNKLPMPYAPGYRQCLVCRPAGAHAVYIVFSWRQSAWHCGFLDEGSDQKLVREVTFAGPDRVRETARRAKGQTSAAARRRVDCVIAERGDGRLWLQLTAAQYLNLQAARLAAAENHGPMPDAARDPL